jgi:protein-S-isoprenylcysteine O-methyltransferase Ste14
MITGMIFILAGQALLLQSPAHGLWAALFFLSNSIYFPLAEEPALRRRFGSVYLAYAENVPRWLPRLTPWRDKK